MDGIKVSFIIPAYNVAPYIGNCIESVLTQSIEKEIIIINDGSTDRTADEAQKYADKYSFIKIINKSNQGLSSARNDGVSIARGEYVCFIDADDYFLEDFAGDFYKLCKLHRLDIIRGFYARAYPDGRIKKVIHPVSFLNCPLNSYDYLAKSVYEKAMEVVAVAGFIRRDFLINHKLKFEEGLCYEDRLFYLKLLLSSKNCTVMQTDRCIYGYRMREGSITKTTDKKKLIDLIKIMRKQIFFIDNLELNKYYITAANKVASASLSHLTSLYLRLSSNERREIIGKIPGRLKLRALRYSYSFRDFIKLSGFIFFPRLFVLIFNLKCFLKKYRDFI
ncbi:glycosyltransferase involved in cell wall biosynthesis [Herbinix hemicellulosilytica]|uniref:Glycosyltransferase 2-like domain-containing protein n=1 Tax=Herbinix hemicellulosilytica TaxID=1564487 RepID=A0A0H5SF48_HERHM|nr:glycosyltransferase [Herbinix hemicellulosilytica]RBP58385.1 glycosyltransferase involved in cell wall biosynthesis [Herbinix hemicellulosilytica]CRZ34102.1 hypothetical protein HHT355_0899 [Herbinix hemicellulosilytica]